MVRASQILSLFMAVALAATAVFCCIPTASAAPTDVAFSAHGDAMAGHCDDRKDKRADGCEFEQSLTQNVPQSPSLSLSTLGNAQAVTVATALQWDHRPVAWAVPAPPKLRTLTPLSLHTQLRI